MQDRETGDNLPQEWANQNERSPGIDWMGIPLIAFSGHRPPTHNHDTHRIEANGIELMMTREWKWVCSICFLSLWWKGVGGVREINSIDPYIHPARQEDTPSTKGWIIFTLLTDGLDWNFDLTKLRNDYYYATMEYIYIVEWDSILVLHSPHFHDDGIMVTKSKLWKN